MYPWFISRGGEGRRGKTEFRFRSIEPQEPNVECSLCIPQSDNQTAFEYHTITVSVTIVAAVNRSVTLSSLHIPWKVSYSHLWGDEGLRVHDRIYQTSCNQPLIVPSNTGNRSLLYLIISLPAVCTATATTQTNLSSSCLPYSSPRRCSTGCLSAAISHTSLSRVYLLSRLPK